MPTIASRITNTGTYFINGEFDEITKTTIGVTTANVYAALLDEISIFPIAGGLAKREMSNGTLMVANGFDEVNKPT
jgi:hypothetical protein